ncbi:hypothetical protein G3N92_05080 [Burkholderia sp. Ac-20379]|nr:hypothetical protein [Burkholderia sp. Ac-20379]
MADRAQQQMDVHFPGVPAQWLWRRKSNHGFSTIPRTLPIAMQIIDAQAKGHPAGHTLFCLWARSPDHPVVAIENPATFASEAGFTGERAVDTWRRRMKRLRELQFIATKPGSSGEFHYVLLLNPNAAIEWMRSNKMVQDGLYARFLERAADIGAFTDVEAIRKYWTEQAAAAQAQAAIQEAAKPPSASEPTPNI